MSSLMTTGVVYEDITMYTAIVSGVGVGTQTILSATNPSWIGINHGNARLDYDLLARDIDMFLQTETSPVFDEWRIDAFRFQRRMDNIQAVAPAL